MDEFTNNAAQIIHDAALKSAELETHTAAPLEVGKGQYLITTKDQVIRNITDEQRRAAEVLAPWRRTGTAQLKSLDSLITWTNRNKGATSMLFANPDQTKPSLTCIANYHAGGAPAAQGEKDETASHCDHRAVYDFPVSKEWQLWNEISGEPMSSDQLANLIEDNIKDIVDPTPALLGDVEAQTEWERRLIEVAAKFEGKFGTVTQLIRMSREFTVNESSDLTAKVNRDTGEQTFQFKNEHKDEQGAPIKIPTLFLITIPVFEMGAVYRLPVRFRYRKSGPKIMFTLTLHDPQKAFDDAFNEACNEASEQTELSLLVGTPES
ncbi:DUF2303 family protein [Shimia thalassica]|uniref:DUF2303 family protein n=1 Tax=Shimia thalassica TaxID=1715693 RepID=UPI0027351EBA|nr:DUF2303 family protein [Shimia thalassica]MDP2495891.1 DUF2303 family protein [Shimia thalassica]